LGDKICNHGAIKPAFEPERTAPVPTDTIRRKRILLVDDEESVRGAYGMMLSIDEHQVVEAGNGKEALEQFDKGPYDLVITDFEMPVMKGGELATRLKQLAPSLPILMITAYGKEVGDPSNPVDAILNKPFTLEELRGAIAGVLKAKVEKLKN
jgi:CheY-like chemotaxis protein